MKVKQKIAKVLLGALVVGATIIPVAAAVVEVDGGTWDYGVDDENVWSYYYHGSKEHKASVVGFVINDSGWKSADVWARAKAVKRILPNHSYYDVR